MDSNRSLFIHGALKAIAVLMIIPLVLALVIALLILLTGYGRVYETTSIEDYGKITGNFDNDAPVEFINSFFPIEIEGNFSDISYHYKAKKGDTYAYECYLEFVIEDMDAYSAFVEKHIVSSQTSPFPYDEAFVEQSVSNVLYLHPSKNGEGKYPIGTAELGKILYSDQQQRFIFIALGMYDGGGATTEELGRFFSRFHIDPWEYAKSAFASGYYQELGITNEEMGTEGQFSCPLSGT